MFRSLSSYYYVNPLTLNIASSLYAPKKEKHKMQALTSLFSLENRTPLVTGGTRGIGAQMAIALAEAGAAIVIVQVSRLVYFSSTTNFTNQRNREIPRTSRQNNTLNP
jgi:hypothetical protein